MRRVVLLLALIITSACSESAGVAPESTPRAPHLALQGGPSFWYRCVGMVCEFGSDNWDATSQFWEFGDGATGNFPHVHHTYPAEGGTYVVRYTATDYAGIRYSTTKTINLLALTVRGYKARGKNAVELSWAPSNGAVDIYRDNVLVAQISDAENTGDWVDYLNTRGKTHPVTYLVCIGGTRICTNTATAFP